MFVAADRSEEVGEFEVSVKEVLDKVVELGVRSRCHSPDSTEVTLIWNCRMTGQGCCKWLELQSRVLCKLIHHRGYRGVWRLTGQWVLFPYLSKCWSPDLIAFPLGLPHCKVWRIMMIGIPVFMKSTCFARVFNGCIFQFQCNSDELI